MKEHSNFPIHLCMHCAHMKVLICKEQHIKLPDFNDILAPVLWHQIGALCSLNTARFIHANLIYAATCANLSVIFPCRLAKTFGSTSEATCQEQPSREDVVLHFLPIPLLCSRNQFTGAIFAKAWPYKNGWMKRHEYTYELVLQACLFRATKLGAWAIQSQCQRRPCQGCIETFSSQPWANANRQVLFHCIQVMRNGHVPRHRNYGKHSSCRCSVGRIMVKCIWNVMTV